MNSAPHSPSSSSARVEPARLQQLEQKYTALDAQITDSPVKQALSVLHAMVHEVRREAGGRPTIFFTGAAANVAAKLGAARAQLSITHTESTAVAFVILES